MKSLHDQQIPYTDSEQSNSINQDHEGVVGIFTISTSNHNTENICIVRPDISISDSSLFEFWQNLD
jgi:hypothetical protein